MNLSDVVSQENADRKLEIEEAVNGLDHTARAILYLWVTGYTQAEIGIMFGYSHQHISRILANIHENVQK